MSLNPKVIVLYLVGAAAAVGVGYATGLIGGGDAPSEGSIFHDNTPTGGKINPQGVVFDEASDCDNFSDYTGYDSRDECLRENFLDDDAAKYGGAPDANWQDPFFTNPLEHLPLAQGIQEPSFEQCEAMVAGEMQDAQQVRDCLNELVDEQRNLIDATQALYGTNGLLVTDNPELAEKSANIGAAITISCPPEGKQFGEYLSTHGNNAQAALANFYQDIVVCTGAIEAQEGVAAGVNLTAQDAGITQAFNEMSSVWGETIQAYSALVAARFGSEHATRDLADLQHRILP
jgi:hypothetical protein